MEAAPIAPPTRTMSMTRRAPAHGPMQIKKGQKVSFTAQLPMPHDAPYSFESRNNSVKWRADVSIDIPN